MEKQKATPQEVIAIILFSIITFFLIGAFPVFILVPILVSAGLIFGKIWDEMTNEID